MSAEPVPVALHAPEVPVAVPLEATRFGSVVGGCVLLPRVSPLPVPAVLAVLVGRVALHVVVEGPWCLGARARAARVAVEPGEGRLVQAPAGAEEGAGVGARVGSATVAGAQEPIHDAPTAAPLAVVVLGTAIPDGAPVSRMVRAARPPPAVPPRPVQAVAVDLRPAVGRVLEVALIGPLAVEGRRVAVVTVRAAPVAGQRTGEVARPAGVPPVAAPLRAQEDAARPLPQAEVDGRTRTDQLPPTGGTVRAAISKQEDRRATVETGAVLAVVAETRAVPEVPVLSQAKVVQLVVRARGPVP